MNEPCVWDPSEVGAIRALVDSATEEDIVALLEEYRARGRKNPVAYASNGKTNGRLARDLQRIQAGPAGMGGVGDAGQAQTEPGISRRLVLTAASQITPKPVLWGWEDRMPAGHLSLIPGREGIGKSLFLIWLTAQITRGMLPGIYHGTPRPVFYCATEDSWQHTIVPRLIAAGADLTKVYRIDVEFVEAPTGTSAVAGYVCPGAFGWAGFVSRSWDCSLMRGERVSYPPGPEAGY